MAWHYCHNTRKHGLSTDPVRSLEGKSDFRFWIGSQGRPPKQCNECRGLVNEPQPVIEPEPTALNTLPNDIDTVKPQPVITEDDGKINFYEKDCFYCQNNVPEKQGFRFKADGAWQVRHKDCGPSTAVSPVPASDPITAIDPSTNLMAEVSRITNEIVDPIVKRNVDRALTIFVQDTLPPMLKTAMQAAEVVRHEFVIDGKVIDIQGTTNKVFPTLMTMLTAGVPGKRLNVALPGPAGSGKSFMAVQAANAMEIPIGIISFGPMTNTSKLFGYMDANGNYVRTPFREIWEFGGIFLADEMDNAHPGLLAELNQALAGDIAAFADGMVKRHPEFRCVATMNTFGKGPDRLYAGRNQLDAATLNRFVWLEVGYDEGLETKMALAFATDETEAVIQRWIRFVQATRAKAEEAKLPLVFGPRNTEQGAMLLANGMDWDAVVEACMFASVSAEVRARLQVRI